MARRTWTWVAATWLAGCGAETGASVDDGPDAIAADAAGAGASDGAVEGDGAPATEDAAVADALAPDALAPDAAPPSGPPYAVGYRQSSVTYASVPDGDRTLRLVYWYPAAAGSEGDAPRYFRGLVRRPGILTDAPLAAGGPFPVLLFSHGSGGIAEQSFFLTEAFAAAGWVVVAPDHTGNTLVDMGAPITRMFFLRPQDARAALDAVWTDDVFAGRLSDRAFVAGHSFGGYTTMAAAGMAYATEALEAACADPAADEGACAVLLDPVVRGLFEEGFGDPRLLAAVPMAPADVVSGDPAAIDVPVLLVTAGRDETLPEAAHADPIWRRLDGPSDLRLDFPEAGHFTFSDVCTAIPGALNRDGCAADNTPPAEVHAVVRDVVFAFARRHVLGLAGDEPALDAFSSEIGTLSSR